MTQECMLPSIHQMKSEEPKAVEISSQTQSECTEYMEIIMRPHIELVYPTALLYHNNLNPVQQNIIQKGSPAIMNTCSTSPEETPELSLFNLGHLVGLERIYRDKAVIVRASVAAVVSPPFPLRYLP